MPRVYILTLQHLLDHQKSKRVPKKTSVSALFIDHSRAFDSVAHNKLWKILQEMEYQTTWPASWEVCMQVKKQQLELDMEQQTCTKLRKEYIKAVYCHPAYLTDI